jgi:hypothetical protein
MSSFVDTLEHAGLVLSGAVVCYAWLKWRQHQGRAAASAQAGTVLQEAKQEAEIILRDARLAANEQALKAHEQSKQALAARRAERLELERRLAEREGLINSQLQRIIEGEAKLNEQKEKLEEREKQGQVVAQDAQT